MKTDECYSDRSRFRPIPEVYPASSVIRFFKRLCRAVGFDKVADEDESNRPRQRFYRITLPEHLDLFDSLQE